MVKEIRGVEKVVVTPSKEVREKFSEEGIKTKELNIPWEVVWKKRDSYLGGKDFFYLLVAIFRFLLLVKEEKPHLIYTNSQKAHIIGVIGGKFMGRGVVVHFRDILPKRIDIKIWLHFLCRLSDAVIAISKSVAKSLPKSNKIRVVYNGVKIKSLPKNSPPPPYKIGYVGQIARWKGVKYFVDAAKLIVKERGDVIFFIIGGPIFGDIHYLEELKAEVEKLEDSIKFVGNISDPLSYINTLHIVVYPSIEDEPFGRVLIEANSLGKPVIATNVGAIPEIIKDGVNGILIPPRDVYKLKTAIEELITNTEKREKMGKKGKEVVRQRFNLEEKVRQIEGIILSKLNEGSFSS